MEAWKDPQTFAIGLGFVIFIVLFLGALIVVILRLYTRRLLREHKEQARLKIEHQQKLAGAAVEIQEKERSRIAADLHDDLVGRLRSIHLMLNMPDKTYEKPPEEYLRESIEMTRSISHDLMPPMVEQSTLHELIEEAVFILRKRHSVVLHQLRKNEPPIDTETKLQIVRIIKEVINNIDKHADADDVEVLSRINENAIILLIRDNGKGFPENKDGGLGMKNIELRSQILKAWFDLSNRQSGGTRFIFYLARNK